MEAEGNVGRQVGRRETFPNPNFYELSSLYGFCGKYFIGSGRNLLLVRARPRYAEVLFDLIGWLNQAAP